MSAPENLFEKIFRRHIVTARPDGGVLLYIDRHFVHDGARNAFENLRSSNRSVRRPAQTFGFADHLVPTLNQAAGIDAIANDDARIMAKVQLQASKDFGFTLFGLGDARQGIVHVVGPEQGLVQPGLTIVCGDSHTSTHGAFGALAFGIGSSEVAHVLATQTLWQRWSKTMRVVVDGALPFGVTAKDIILTLISRIGAAGATEHVIEFAGSTIAAMSMDERMTLCNMAIEAGSRTGLVAPDDTTFEYLAGRPFAPAGAEWDRAVALWRTLHSDPGAHHDREVHLFADEVIPSITWGTSPEDVAPITGVVPDPSREPDVAKRARQERALRYMDLAPGVPIASIKIDRVFIGSCTNSRLEDLRQAARVVQGKKAVVPAMIVPGSWPIRRAAEAEGLDRIFVAAGFEWREPGCSMCLGMNGDILQPGERCASTSNRNFEGRQGQGGRTHLVSPTMAAAAALTGRLTDVRTLGDR
jgi:3-isopropylmalate/(R)-2-methylmalate dehydratase large subunit